MEGGNEKRTLIRFGYYNIRNSQNGGLESALLRMDHFNLGLGILQETKVTDGVYTRGSTGGRANPKLRQSVSVLPCLAAILSINSPSV